MKNYIEAESTYPVCPYCENEIEETNEPTYEAEDVFVYMYRHGECPTCRRKYSWSEIYKWDDRFYNFKEVSKR